MSITTFLKRKKVVTPLESGTIDIDCCRSQMDDIIAMTDFVADGNELEVNIIFRGNSSRGRHVSTWEVKLQKASYNLHWCT
jgi:hypothetical protein